MITVTIVETQGAEAPIIELYSGEEYHVALQKAAEARNHVAGEWRGKWIRFATPTKVKWAEIN